MSLIDKLFFSYNRERVYDKLKGGVLVVPAYTQMQRSNDTAATFEQEANFWYLTGIDYPDWWLFMDAKRRRSWLVAPTVAEHHQLFDGSLDPTEALWISGVDEVIDRQEADSWLRQAARTHQLVYTVDVPPHADHFGFVMNPAAKEMRERLERIFAKVQNFRPELTRLRAIKQPAEIDAIQSAVDLTVKSYRNIYDNLQNYKHEYEIEADFTAAFRRAGARGHAYDPIIAMGANACTLHYTRNQDKLKKGQLILIDVGARLGGYAADITRTYAYGKLTARQKAVHEAVESAQRKIVDLIQPGLPVAEYQRQVDTIMQRALIELKLIKDEKDEAYHTYFPHAISHGLGIDVHDALGQPRTLESGMVLTVEPGIYIPEEGIGVRIEDDILVTETGHKNLSAKLSTSY